MGQRNKIVFNNGSLDLEGVKQEVIRLTSNWHSDWAMKKHELKQQSLALDGSSPLLSLFGILSALSQVLMAISLRYAGRIDSMDVTPEPPNSQDNVEDSEMIGAKENVSCTCDCGGSSSKCAYVTADDIRN
ncbi:hypothetical protein PIB30_068489 [Stylosanthes scabra]|uniref:Uncharacterized protein n=1 Tax=Stylosanthes scabra TaxID=79078 RepID=A0ABU6SN12_9FABA|nr:hypothetical protein [Stylosanthes scabra]